MHGLHWAFDKTLISFLKDLLKSSIQFRLNAAFFCAEIACWMN